MLWRIFGFRYMLIGMYIASGLPLLDRDSTSVQIGTDPELGVIIDELSEQDKKILRYFHENHLVPKLGKRFSVSPQRSEELINKLKSAGIVVPEKSTRVVSQWLDRCYGSADALELFARSRILIRGMSTLGILLAQNLFLQGIKSLSWLDSSSFSMNDFPTSLPELLKLSRQEAAEKILGKKSSRFSNPHLEIGISSYVPDYLWIQECLSQDRPHLLVVVRECHIEVGPLVVPGRSACVRCRNLNLLRREPLWGKLDQQLINAKPLSVDYILGSQVAAFIAKEVFDYLGGLSHHCKNGSWIFKPTSPIPYYQQWFPEPDCGCIWT